MKLRKARGGNWSTCAATYTSATAYTTRAAATTEPLAGEIERLTRLRRRRAQCIVISLGYRHARRASVDHPGALRPRPRFARHVQNVMSLEISSELPMGRGGIGRGNNQVKTGVAGRIKRVAIDAQALIHPPSNAFDIRRCHQRPVLQAAPRHVQVGIGRCGAAHPKRPIVLPTGGIRHRLVSPQVGAKVGALALLWRKPRQCVRIPVLRQLIDRRLYFLRPIIHRKLRPRMSPRRREHIINHQPKPHRQDQHRRHRRQLRPAVHAQPRRGMAFSWIEKRPALDLPAKRFVEFHRRGDARQVAQQPAGGAKLGDQRLVLRIGRQVLLDLRPLGVIELSFNIGTELRLDFFLATFHLVSHRLRRPPPRKSSGRTQTSKADSSR